MNDLQQLFLKDNPVKILIQLHKLQEGNGGTYTQQKIADKLDMPKSNVSRIAFQMEDQYNLIQSEREGREKYLGLTTEGRKTAQQLQNVLEACQQ